MAGSIILSNIAYSPSQYRSCLILVLSGDARAGSGNRKEMC